jgi:hypothetical protein
MFRLGNLPDVALLVLSEVRTQPAVKIWGQRGSPNLCHLITGTVFKRPVYGAHYCCCMALRLAAVKKWGGWLWTGDVGVRVRCG